MQPRYFKYERPKTKSVAYCFFFKAFSVEQINEYLSHMKENQSEWLSECSFEETQAQHLAPGYGYRPAGTRKKPTLIDLTGVSQC